MSNNQEAAHYNLKSCLKHAVVKEDYEGISFLIKSQGVTVDDAYVMSARVCRPELMGMLRGMGAKCHNEAMTAAAISGNLPLVRMLEKGQVLERSPSMKYDDQSCYPFIDYNPVLYAAISGCHRELVDWLAKKPLPTVDYGIVSALLRKCKQPDFAEYLLQILPEDSVGGVENMAQVQPIVFTVPENELEHHVAEGNLVSVASIVERRKLSHAQSLKCLKLSVLHGHLRIADLIYNQRLTCSNDEIASLMVELSRRKSKQTAMILRWMLSRFPSAVTRSTMIELFPSIPEYILQSI